MHPVLLEIGSFKIHMFGVMLALGVLAGSSFMARQAQQMGDPRITPERMQSVVWWGVVGVILGGRIMYVIVEMFRDGRVADRFASAPWEALYVWEGGLVMYGGFLGVFIAVVAYAYIHKLSILRLCDIVGPGAFLGQAIGRWGCLFAGDDYGRPTANPDAWYAIKFNTAKGALIPERLNDIPLHPTQIYMSLKAFTVFLVIWWVSRHKKFDGQVTGTTLMLYAVLRSVVELFRGDEDRGSIGFLSTAQFTSVFMFLIGASIIAFAPRGTAKPLSK